MVTTAKIESNNISNFHIENSSIIFKDNSSLSLIDLKNQKKE